MLHHRMSLAAIAAAALFALPALAQDTTAPAAPAAPAPAAAAPAAAAPAAAPADGPGSAYVAATFGDWEQRCVRTEEGSDPCQLYQLLKDENGGSVAEFTIMGLRAGGEAAAGATIITPLDTLLTEGIAMQVDGGKTKRYPFTFCTPMGCVARVGFTAAELDALKKGNTGQLAIVPLAAPDKHVVVALSLKGFTAGLDAVNAANAAMLNAQPEAPKN